MGCNAGSVYFNFERRVRRQSGGAAQFAACDGGAADRAAGRGDARADADANSNNANHGANCDIHRRRGDIAASNGNVRSKFAERDDCVKRTDARAKRNLYLRANRYAHLARADAISWRCRQRRGAV